MNKVCSKCNIEKEVGEFYNKINQCKECHKQCVKEYQDNNKEKVKNYYLNNKERIKEKIKENNQTENGRKLQRKRSKKQYSTHYGKEKVKVCNKLRYAVKIGEVIKPCNCQCCDSEVNIQAHHHSYMKGFELDVIWVCKSCHTAMHKAIKEFGIVLHYE